MRHESRVWTGTAYCIRRAFGHPVSARAALSAAAEKVLGTITTVSARTARGHEFANAYTVRARSVIGIAPDPCSCAQK
jgi:hypothetical protein